jgi:hypothetical protein
MKRCPETIILRVYYYSKIYANTAFNKEKGLTPKGVRTSFLQYTENIEAVVTDIHLGLNPFFILLYLFHL